jgi:hypothetical protein
MGYSYGLLKLIFEAQRSNPAHLIFTLPLKRYLEECADERIDGERALIWLLRQMQECLLCGPIVTGWQRLFRA